MPSSPAAWVPAGQLCGGEGVARRMRRGQRVGAWLDVTGSDRGHRPLRRGDAPGAALQARVTPLEPGRDRGAAVHDRQLRAASGQSRATRPHTHVATPSHLDAALCDAHHPVHPVSVVQARSQRVAQLQRAPVGGRRTGHLCQRCLGRHSLANRATVCHWQATNTSSAACTPCSRSLGAEGSGNG
jgi:hypothetical protein